MKGHSWNPSPGFAFLFVLALFVCTALCVSSVAEVSGSEYVYDKMWPLLEQPWYFSYPSAVDIDKRGNICILDSHNERVLLFSPSGNLISAWGEYGQVDWENKGGMQGPEGLAFDRDGNVVVADTQNHRVHIFDSEGDLIRSLGENGTGDGQFQCPKGVAVDPANRIWVSDTGNNRLQVFSSDGTFIQAYGSEGSGEGQLRSPLGLHIDSDAIYTADSGNHRIQKWDLSGQFLMAFGAQEGSDGQLDSPFAVAADGDGNLYVVDAKDRVVAFDGNGKYIRKWGSNGTDNGCLQNPRGIAVDDQGRIVVADSENHRMQIFSARGSFLSLWGNTSSRDGDLLVPRGIARDGDGNIYVADTSHHRIQKFTGDGVFIDSWGGLGEDSGKFNHPVGICVRDNSVYVTDYWNHRVQKFGLDGIYHAEWGRQGTANGQFERPEGIAADSDGNLYVSDSYNYRVQKFSPDGDFLRKWGEAGGEDGMFGPSDRTEKGPSGIAVAPDGFVYVADPANHRVQKFDQSGKFVTSLSGIVETEWSFPFRFPQGLAFDDAGNLYVSNSWIHQIWKFSSEGDYLETIGGFGSDMGLLNTPCGLCVTGDGASICVAEEENHRVQVFSIEEEVQKERRAIIVAGSGSEENDPLFEAVQLCANYAYRALAYQGYSRDNIQYLSNTYRLDVAADNGTENNDKTVWLYEMDALATRENLEEAIGTWAKDSKELLIYMVGHGGSMNFRLNESETIDAEALDSLLDSVEGSIQDNIVVLIDACRAGSFIETLKGPDRIIATSSGPDEPSLFADQGIVSFSFMFWTQIFNGFSFYEAFDRAHKGVNLLNVQTSSLDVNGNGAANEKEDKTLAAAIKLGDEKVMANDLPSIGTVCPDATLAHDEVSATLYAENIVDADGIAYVWAVVTPPEHIAGSPDDPVADLPVVPFSQGEDGRYEAVYDGFEKAGKYKITIFAQDRLGAVGLPASTAVVVEEAPNAGVLYFPFARSEDGTWETEIGVVNSSADSALRGVLKAYDQIGEQIGTPIEVNLPLLGRRQLVVGQDFSNADQIRYVAFESNSDHVVGYQRPYRTGQFRAAAPAAFPGESDVVYVSHIASSDAWKTLISLVNTRDREKELTIRFDNGAVEPIVLGAGQCEQFYVRELFDGAPQEEIHSAEIENARGIVGLELFENASQLAGILLGDRLADRIDYPHIASDNFWETGLVAYNPGEESCTLTIAPYTQTGDPLPVQSCEVPSKDRYFGTVSNLNLPDTAAWVAIESPCPLTGFELFTTLDGRMLAGYTAVDIQRKQGVLPILEQDGDTGIALVNAGDSAAAVTITAYDDDGNAIDVSTVDLAPFEKHVRVARNLFGQSIDEATWLSFDCDNDIVAFELDMSRDRTMLDALPGL